MARSDVNLDHVSAILEASYRYASTPDDPELLFDLAELVSGTPIGDGDDDALRMVERHFELAARLAEQIGAGDEAEPPEALPDWVMVLDADRRVTAAGAQAGLLAARLFEPGSQARGVRFRDPVQQNQFTAAFKRVQSDAVPNVTLRLHDEADDTVCFGYLTRDPDGPGFRLHLIAPVRDLALDSAMLKDLGITPAEVRLLEQFQEGLALREAAAALGISYHTARNQLRSIFDKFGVNRQSDLVRYLTLLASLAGENAAIPPNESAPPALGRFTLDEAIAVYRAAESVTLPDGRVLAYHSFGPENGQPIVMVNGPLTTFLITRTMWQALFTHGIRLVAPHRPGFGGSTALSQLGFDTVAADAAAFGAALAARTGFTRFPVIGFSGSSSLALSLAEGLGGHAGPLGLIAPQFQIDHDAGGRDRFSTRFFRDSMSAPWAMEFGLAVFRTRLSSAIVGGLMDRIFEGSPTDARYLESHPELRTLIIEASKLSLESPARVILAEAALMRQGRDPRQRTLQTPMLGWHGSADGISPLGDEQAARAPFDRFEVIEGGGHLIFATHFDRIIPELLAALDA